MTTHQIQPTLLPIKQQPKNSDSSKLAAKKQGILSFINEELSTLKDNWDGYGASPIEHTVLNHLEFLIHKMPTICVDSLSTDSILPNPNGTVSLEWSSDTRELFLEIGNQYATYYIKYMGKIETMNNHFVLSNNVEFRQFIKYLKSYF